MTASLVFEARDIVGESLVWSPAERALYWVDIVGARIHRLEPESGRHDLWLTPELPTSIGLRKDGGFVVGLRRRVTLWRPDGPFETLAIPEPDLPGNRLNEGVVAPDGSFWVGSMADNIGPDGSARSMSGDAGRLYRIAPDGAVARLSEDVFGITNTMVWLPDGRFLTADTLRNEFYLYDRASPTMLANRRPLGLQLVRGVPDGSTSDASGRIYNARVGGGASIARIDIAERSVAYLELPCQSPTSCVFGGRDLDILFVVSARFGLPPSELKDNRVDGGLFAFETRSKGVPCRAFG